MNFLALGAKSLKKAQKARTQAAINKQQMEDHGIPCNIDPNAVFEETLERDYQFMEDAMEIGIRYFKMAKERLGANATYMLSIRPPDKTDLAKFVRDVSFFVGTWAKKWSWFEYAFEQVGETAETMGKGFHCHLIFEINATNYYRQHILRDAFSGFPYVAQPSIHLDKLFNVERAKEYIRGIKKDDDKELGVEFNTPWREKVGLLNLYDTNTPRAEVKYIPLLFN
jgi:hypothetical protein